MKKINHNTIRRLSRAAMFGVVRGLASAAGATALAWIIWWIESR